MNEKGISLVETIASLLIATVILFSFYSFFISSKKSNVQSSSISDATYAAQIEMESIYTLASSGTSSLATLPSNFLPNYTLSTSSVGSCSTKSTDIDEYKKHYEFLKTDSKYIYRTSVYELCHFQSSGRVEVEVSENSSGAEVLKAKVEGVYLWK